MDKSMEKADPPPYDKGEPDNRLPAKLTYNTYDSLERCNGYHRAVRRGPFIAVSGIPPRDAATGSMLKNRDPYPVTLNCLQQGIDAVKGLGGTKEDIIRVRIWVQVKASFEPAGDALRAVFGNRGPSGDVAVAASIMYHEDPVTIYTASEYQNDSYRSTTKQTQRLDHIIVG